jgi:RNA polymerase sigma-70 factor (ECF subfamily)
MTGHAIEHPDFARLIAELRPKLHRYCARMTGSVIDGEDVVQEALLKAIDALPTAEPLANPEGWLFRIAHNTALDFLHSRARRESVHAPEDPDMIVSQHSPLHDREIAAASLRIFMRLPVAQRSALILRDVLGHSLAEVCEIMDSSIPAAKSALQRGRARVHELAQEPEEIAPPVLAEPERQRLMKYVECFCAHDFDTVRAMLAADVQLDLVNRLRASGRDGVGEYFHRYALADHWQFAPGFVDRRPAMLVFDRHDSSGRPAYFVLLDWKGDSVISIRDFLFARYALEGAELLALNWGTVPARRPRAPAAPPDRPCRDHTCRSRCRDCGSPRAAAESRHGGRRAHAA